MILSPLHVGCSSIVTTTDDEGLPYNDNSWHHLYVIRNGKEGSIVMDGRWTGKYRAVVMSSAILLYSLLNFYSAYHFLKAGFGL